MHKDVLLQYFLCLMVSVAEFLVIFGSTSWFEVFTLGFFGGFWGVVCCSLWLFVVTRPTLPDEGGTV